MASEATVTVALQFVKGTIPVQVLASGAVSRDVAGASYIRNVQTVGTSEEALVVGDTGSAGSLVVMHNLDSTNYIDVKPATGVAACIKLLAGDWALFRFSGAAPFVQANTASCNLEYFLISA